MTVPADTTATSTVDLAAEAVLDDPFGELSRMREQAPLLPGRLRGTDALGWLALRYDHVRTVLSDPRFVKNPATLPDTGAQASHDQMMQAFGVPEEYQRFLTSILDLDGAEHARMRKLVSRTFTVRRVNELRPRVAELTDDLLDELEATGRNSEHGEVDLLEDFALTLTMTVICELVGIPEGERSRWQGWGVAMGSGQPARFGGAVREMVDHIRELIAHRRDDPANDLLSGMIRTHDEHDGQLTETEMITMVLSLVMAGHDTTAQFICNATAELLTHPDQLARLRAEPDLLPGAVHELLRWCGPAQVVGPRYAAEDLDIGDVRVRRGEAVTPVLVAANYDPREFDAPHRLDIAREPTGRGESHVAFGHGAHYCLGAALARQEGEVALGGLLARFDGLTLAARPRDLERDRIPGAWRLSRLPLRLSPE